MLSYVSRSPCISVKSCGSTTPSGMADDNQVFQRKSAEMQETSLLVVFSNFNSPIFCYSGSELRCVAAQGDSHPPVARKKIHFVRDEEKTQKPSCQAFDEINWEIAEKCEIKKPIGMVSIIFKRWEICNEWWENPYIMNNMNFNVNANKEKRNTNSLWLPGTVPSGRQALGQLEDIKSWVSSTITIMSLSKDAYSL